MYLSNKCWFAFPWSSFSYYICLKKSDKIISNTFNIHIWVQGHLCTCSRNWKALLWLEHSSEDCSETSPHTDAENIKLIWDRLLLQWSMLLSNFPQVPPRPQVPTNTVTVITTMVLFTKVSQKFSVWPIKNQNHGSRVHLLSL